VPRSARRESLAKRGDFVRARSAGCRFHSHYPQEIHDWTSGDIVTFRQRSGVLVTFVSPCGEEPCILAFLHSFLHSCILALLDQDTSPGLPSFDNITPSTMRQTCSMQWKTSFDLLSMGIKGARKDVFRFNSLFRNRAFRG
jgi:hypothetical protein